MLSLSCLLCTPASAVPATGSLSAYTAVCVLVLV